MDGIEDSNGPMAEDVAKLENEVKKLRREVSEMKELIRSLLQVLMENADDDDEDMYSYT